MYTLVSRQYVELLIWRREKNCHKRETWKSLQVSILGPILHNLCTYDISKTSGMEIALYAEFKNLNYLGREMYKVLNCVQEWRRKWKVKINGPTSQTVIHQNKEKHAGKVKNWRKTAIE